MRLVIISFNKVSTSAPNSWATSCISVKDRTPRVVRPRTSLRFSIWSICSSVKFNLSVRNTCATVLPAGVAVPARSEGVIGITFVGSRLFATPVIRLHAPTISSLVGSLMKPASSRFINCSPLALSHSAFNWERVLISFPLTRLQTNTSSSQLLKVGMS